MVDDAGGGGDNPTPDPNPKPETFSVTVPTTINISMGLSGKITVPSNLEIINNNDSGIKLTNVDVQLLNNWTAANFDDITAPVTDTSTTEEDKRISFAFRGDKMNSQGLIDVTPESWNFAPTSALPLNTRVRIPKQLTATEVDIANINWEFDWSDSDISSDPSIGADIDVPTEEKVTVTFIEPEGVTIKGSKTLELKTGDKLKFPEVELNGIRYEVENWIDNDTKEVLSSDYIVTKDTNVSLTLKEKEANPKNWFTANGNTLTGLSDEYLNMVDAPTDLVIPNNIGGSKITAIGANAFANKDLLTSIVVPNTVISIAADAFTGTSADLKIDVSYAAQYSIANSPWGANISSIIWSDERLEDWNKDPISSLELPDRGITTTGNGIVSGVSNTSITDVVIPTSIDGVKVVSIAENAFKSNTKLTSVTIPDTVTNIGSSAFYGCTGLISVNVPNSVTTIGSNAFYNVAKLEYFGTATYNNYAWGAALWINNDTVTEAELTSMGMRVDVNGGIYQIDTTSISGDVVIPSNVDGKPISHIGSSGFRSNLGIKGVTLPDTVTYLQPNAFQGCTNLETVNFEKLVNIGNYAFAGCTNLKNIELSKYSITTIGNNAFDSCKSLKYVDFSKCFQRPYIGTHAFTNTNCVVALPSYIGTLQSTSLTSTLIIYSGTAPSGSWGGIVAWKTIEEYEECKSNDTDPITAAELANRGLGIVNSTYVYALDNSTLSGEVVIPSSVDGVLVTSIKYEAFKDNTNITKVTLPNTLNKINRDVFSGCTGIQSITVPNSVTTIGANAFLNIPEVKYSGTAEGSPWGAKSIVPNN